jgi:hypothetical protein
VSKGDRKLLALSPPTDSPRAHWLLIAFLSARRSEFRGVNTPGRGLGPFGGCNSSSRHEAGGVDRVSPMWEAGLGRFRACGEVYVASSQGREGEAELGLDANSGRWRMPIIPERQVYAS